MINIKEEELVASDIEDVEEEPHNYGLRGNRTRSYDYRFASAIDNPVDGKRYYSQTTSENQFVQVTQGAHEKADFRTTQKALTGWILTQMTAKAGIRRYGDAACDAMRASSIWGRRSTSYTRTTLF